MTQTPHETRNQTSGSAGADPGHEAGSVPEPVGAPQHDPWASPQPLSTAHQPSQAAPQSPAAERHPYGAPQPPSAPQSGATGPIWYGQTGELPRTSAFGTLPPGAHGPD